MSILMNLNEQQKKAVILNSKKTIIIAGAGSGKTRTITSKIAYLIENHNIDPKNILAVTFTNKAANEMKERVIKLIDKNISYNDLNIYTYHSLCARILKISLQWWNDIAYTRSFNIIDETDQKQIINQILKNNQNEIFNAKKALNLITFSKSNKYFESNQIENEDFDDFELSDYEIKSFKDIFKKYEINKIKNNLLDFNDLILLTHKMLETNVDIRKYWQEKYNHILIDEFQDTSKFQFEIIKFLSLNNNLTIVGDPDQNIYSWRNADSSILTNFSKENKDVQIIKLEENYRSTKTIINHSNLLIKHNKNRFPKELYTKNPSGEKIIYYDFASSYEEAKWIVKKIKAIKKEKKKPNKIAVLYRSKFISLEIERMLLNNSISYLVYGSIKFFERKEIKDTLAYAKAIFLNDNFSFLRIINIPKRKIGTATISKITNYASQNNFIPLNLLFNHFNKIDNIQISSQAKKNIEKVVNLIKKYQKLINKKNSYDILADLLKEIDYFSIFSFDVKEDKIQNVKELLASIKKWTLKNPSKKFEQFLEEISLFSNENESNDNNRDVILSTVHMSKGLEFENVIVCGMNEEKFPSLRSENIEEERRLFYVAITRAKKRLFLTSISRSFYDNFSKKYLPSRFIKEMKISSFDQVEDNLYYSSQENNLLEGDKIIHDKYGDGVIVQDNDDIIEVIFANTKYGIKQFKKNHKSIKRKI